ncbi:hypothetical protein GpartN1_g2090.t1 [Galdieria partita]|uniref:Magnesium transporter n=1 Tax=Galdieria partita TaxID=83374 RepID=A0A9C7UNW6_9RHOD|nr:hypothetical protein GpartN1_g2090.t1 [Galdieria partita]
MTPKKLFPKLIYTVYQVSLQYQETPGRGLSSSLEKTLRTFLASQCYFDITVLNTGLVFISCGKWKAISVMQNLLLINYPMSADDIIRSLKNDMEFYMFHCFTGRLKTVMMFFWILSVKHYKKKEQVSSFIEFCSTSNNLRNIHAKSSEIITQFYAVSQLSKKQLYKLCIYMSYLLLDMHSKQENALFAFAVDEHETVELLLRIIKKLGQIRESFDSYERILASWKERSKVQMESKKTDVIVYNFISNMVLSATLIGATMGNSFGTNLNVPFYYSTKGYKAALWYIVSFSVIVAVGIFIFIFAYCNKNLVKYIKKQRNHSSQVLWSE